MPTRPRVQPLHVTIVSDNPETIDGLEGYLRAAGVATRSTRHLEESLQLVPPAAAALVLFPDDFPKDLVFQVLADLRTQRPHALPVLVTREPKQYHTAPSPDEGIAPVIVPRPAWGWSILDAIRARSDFEAEGREDRGGTGTTKGASAPRRRGPQ